MEEYLPRKLDPHVAEKLDIKEIRVDQTTFARMHSADRMASDKLQEGISDFTKALENLEKLLEVRLRELDLREVMGEDLMPLQLSWRGHQRIGATRPPFEHFDVLLGNLALTADVRRQ